MTSIRFKFRAWYYRHYPRRVHEQYPALSFLIQHPEVGPLLRKATRRWHPLTPTQFGDALRETEWWKATSVKRPPGIK